MKAALAEVKPKNIEEFKVKVTEVWNQISIDTTIKNFVNSFTLRCYLCLENEGRCIDHLIKRDMQPPTDEQIQHLFEKCVEKGIELREIPLFSAKKQYEKKNSKYFYLLESFFECEKVVFM